MSMLLRIFLLSSIYEVSCTTKLESILFVTIHKKAASAHYPPNETFTGSPQEPINKHTTSLTTFVAKSNKRPATFKSKYKNQKSKLYDVPVKVESSTVTSDSSIATTSANPDITGSNFTSTAALDASNTKLFLRIANATSSVRNDDKSTVQLGFTQRTKVNSIIKSESPGNIARYARLGGDDSMLQPEGYIYNKSHCLDVEDRMLCGYSTNLGHPRQKTVIDLDDICRENGDRIECGYLKGPFPDAYNPNPETDQLAKINIGNYQNIARSGRLNMQNESSKELLTNGNDTDYNPNVTFSTNEAPNLFKPKTVMSKLLSTSSTTNISTTFTNTASPVPTTTSIDSVSASVPTTAVTTENPKPFVTSPRLFKLNTTPTHLTTNGSITAANHTTIQVKTNLT